jgi:sugar lactone lactonase YvrE
LALIPGTLLGPYEIIEGVGAGGMGEVYRATDARLGRDVAIKVLPESLANEADRRARFEREAKAVAALSHPNIINIFDTGLHQGHPFVVMELLDGETLRDRLRHGGALPGRKAVEIAVQIARGLAAAHDAQIVHRDLKPENIFILRDGQVKILDFGLARLTAASSASGATQTIAATDPGIAMGTVGYMAPEQIRGSAVDGRADLFAFGAVLYEMLSGARAFQRDTVPETMTAILKEDAPDLIGANARITPSLDRIVRHCLEKKAAERFQSARDVAFALDALSGAAIASSTASIAVPVPRARRLGLAIAAIAAVVLIAIAVAGPRVLWPAPVAPLWTGVLLGGPEIAMIPQVSPDGSTLAFIAMDGNMTQVAVMKPESGYWALLTHKRNAGIVTGLSWSPDGDKIYFDRTADVPMGVFSVPAVGGDETKVADDANAPAALRDGSLLVTRLNAERKYRIFRFWPETGRFQELPIQPSSVGLGNRAHVIKGDKEAVVQGKYFGEGQAAGPHLYILNLASGKARLLPTGFRDDSVIGGAVAVSPDGQSVLAVGAAGNLHRINSIPLNGSSAPRTVLALTMNVNGLDVGPDGRVYLDQSDGPMAIVKFPPDGGHAEKLALLPRVNDQGYAAVLPDGRFTTTMYPGGHRRLMVIEAGKDPRPLIATQEDTSDPVTGVGRLEVAFMIGSGPRTIGVATLANGRITRRIPFAKGPINALASSPDGQTLYVAASGMIWSMPINGGEPHSVRAGDAVAVDPSGEYLLVQAVEASRTRLFELPVAGGKEREIPLNGPFHLTFDPLSSSSIGRDRRIFVPLASPDDWFFPPGVVDLATGRMTRLPVDHVGDFHFLLRTQEGQVIAGAFDLRSSLWRFQSEVKK